jgi:hypothetical protein
MLTVGSFRQEIKHVPVQGFAARHRSFTEGH